jgi:7-carboxy-7-deazaguanine synthase
MTYSVHSIFLTAQGEGANLGRVAVFIRFAGCNLWSGQERHRATAICQFCDTKFTGGKKYTAESLVEAALNLFPGDRHRMVVLTGGEPLLQADARLINTLRSERFYVAVETNGTLPLPCHVDWVCVSPKARTHLALLDAGELKLVYPQHGIDPSDLADFHSVYRWLSPMDNPKRKANTKAAADYCLAHPEWRLAIQAHKTWGLP